MSNDSGLTVFSESYRRLLDLLEGIRKLPTILQSLGCIAQNAISVLEAHEEDIVNFIVKDLLKTQCAPLDADDDEQCSLSEKIFAIKALVRSFLPNKGSQQVQRLKGLLKILSKFVDSREISNDIESSTDKAHLRVAAAVGILRLSKRYDAQITPQLFKATVSCAKDCPLFLRRQFLSKVEKQLKEHHIPLKYICTFPLTIGVFDSDFLQEVKQQLSDIIQVARRHVRHKDPVDTISSEFYPECVLFHFVHVLANQSDCDKPQSSESMELLVKQLYVFLWALLYHTVEIFRKNDERLEVYNTVSTVYGIFSKLKSAEDMVDSSRTENTYIICDIGLAILKKLLGIEHFDIKSVPNFPLPKMIYARSEETGEKIEGSFLPSSILDDPFFSQILPCGMDVDTNTQKKTDQEEINSVEKEEIPAKKQMEVVASPRKKQKVIQRRDTKPSDHNGQQGVRLLSELSDADGKIQASHQGPKVMVDKDMEVRGMDMLNKKVLIYWPVDKRFYQGRISAYNVIKNLYDVRYDDGDKEILDLRKECWKFVEENDSVIVLPAIRNYFCLNLFNYMGKSFCFGYCMQDRGYSNLASTNSKFHLQLEVKKHSLENEKIPDDKSSSRSHKQAKSDANNLFAKVCKTSSRPAKGIDAKGIDSLNGKDSAPNKGLNQT